MNLLNLILKTIILTFLVGLGLFILWMNLTPGHYQKHPCGFVGYYANNQFKIVPGAIYHCPNIQAFGAPNILGEFELLVANLDFNK